MAWLVLASVLATAPLYAQHQQQPATATTQVSRAARKNAAAVARQRAEVQRLQNTVAAQESDSQAAAEKLKQQDAKIAELHRQLLAVQQAGAAAGQGH